MRGLVLFLMAGYAVGIVVYDSVVFQKVNEITSTRAKWLVTFVHDLQPFRSFVKTVGRDVYKAIEIAKTLRNHFTGEQQEGYLGTLKYLLREAEYLGDTVESVQSNFADYRALGGKAKRSLLPIGGSILSFLFSTLSETDLSDIRQAINDLSGNQQTVVHLLEEQMTILNVSRVHIAENRQALLDLVECLNTFESRMSNLTQAIQERFKHVEMFANVYAQMDLILGGIRDALQRGNLYLGNLRLELNMLSLNHLSPSLITPKDLKRLLTQIKAKLPPTLKLPEDHRSNIWYYYRTLTCTTILEDDRIVVVMSIPLLDFTGQYDVIKIHNIPLPMHEAQTKSPSHSIPTMVAKYDIEYPGLLINKDGNRYTLLSESEIGACSNPITKYCSPRNAILPVNLNKLCVLALYFQKEEQVNEYCRKMVQTNAILPMGTYLTKGQWAIGTKEKLDFSVVCLGTAGRKTVRTQTKQSVSPPLGIIQLDTGCHAVNNFLSLPPYYLFEEQATIIDPNQKLLEIRNDTLSRIWEPFVQALPNFTKLELPENLEQVDNIPMNDLILKLRGLRRVEVEDTSWPLWAYILINLGVSTVITGLLFWYFQYYKKGKHSFECLSCCQHKAIRDKQVEGASDEPPSPLELVPLSKKGVPTAPPGEEEIATPVTLERAHGGGVQNSGQSGNVPLIQALYPVLRHP